MTMRPQFGSSPAMAVFTSGELAMERRPCRHRAPFSRPVTATSTSLVAPSPSRTTCMRQIAHHAGQRAAKAAALARLRPAAMGGACRRPVAASSTVSEVEVSLSTVMALKLASSRCSASPAARPAHARIGEDVGQHRRHVRRDHARALGDARDP
jgi:hypothetical protein